MSIDVSKILDNLHMIEDDMQGRACTVIRAPRGKRPPPPEKRNKCGKPAVYEVLRTCCQTPGVGYWCADHTDENTTMPIGCPYCGHICRPGVCLHRILNPI